MSEKNTEPQDSPVEILEPSAKVTSITIGGQEYVQRPLNFFQKMDLFAVLGDALDKAMSGPNGLSLNSLLDVPDAREGSLTSEDFLDADAFVRAVARLIQFAPELLQDVYCIILGVPRNRRADFKPVLENELSDDEGFQIIETFIDQNWEVLRDFFGQRIQPLITKVQGSESSTPSSPTVPATASQ